MTQIATSASIANKIYQFLTVNYWFATPDPSSLTALFWFEIIGTTLLIIPLALIAFKLVSKSLTPPEQKFLNKAIIWLIWFGPLGWLLVFFRNQGVVLLSARFWWLILFVSLIAVVYYLYRYYRNKLGFSIRQYQAYQTKKRYLPKRKKH